MIGNGKEKDHSLNCALFRFIFILSIFNLKQSEIDKVKLIKIIENFY